MCTLQLLDHSKVLAEFERLLKPGGRAWLSFQWEEVPLDPSETNPNGFLPCPTAHQHVRGVTLDEMSVELCAAKLEVLNVDCCRDAFCTPSPSQDGSLLAVPYLFVEAAKPHSTNTKANVSVTLSTPSDEQVSGPGPTKASAAA